ncbi:MAG: hypothetical protein JRG81_06440 [Deltaproteobacteria bacterium]|nr:hypothetical protein [Deltaproteobacteria bacterium]
MASWNVREELSLENRLRRTYYELLRDELDQFLIQNALIDSYRNFVSRKINYPFVEKRELKPRARIPDQEYESQNAFLLIFLEDTIPAAHKKYIRFFDANKTTKTNLLRSETLSLSSKYDRTQKYLESVNFYSFLKTLLPVDYALLIQRDPASKKTNRYSLTHYHVRIDWPIAEAAEDLARSLRYIPKDVYLYERGEKYAENVQKKFFEYYGLPDTAGGRRTAAIVSAQYLQRVPGIATVYAGSSESRALLRISERGVSRAVLMALSEKEMKTIATENKIAPQTLKKHYVVARKENKYVCIFQATYVCTNCSRSPDDGKLRDLKPDLSWLSIGGEHILPNPGVWRYPPIPYNTIYT